MQYNCIREFKYSNTGMNEMKMTDRVPFMCLMTIMGGFCSAYTFFRSGGVLTNGQTGNTTKFACNFANLSMREMLIFLGMLIACVAGTVYCEYLKDKYQEQGIKNALVVEVGLLMIAGLIPETLSFTIICAVMAFVIGFQIDIFRTCEGEVCNTTICSGTYRTLGQNLYEVIFKKANPHQLIKTVSLLVSFMGGAYVCTTLCNVWGAKTAFVGSFIVGIVYVLVIADEKQWRVRRSYKLERV